MKEKKRREETQNNENLLNWCKTEMVKSIELKGKHIIAKSLNFTTNSNATHQEKYALQ